jgi:hypothetical protein
LLSFDLIIFFNLDFWLRWKREYNILIINL